MNGFTRSYGHLEMMSPQQVEFIDRSIMKVLWETGVTIDDDAALQLMSENGCSVDPETRRVKIPETLVEECLAKAPICSRSRPGGQEQCMRCSWWANIFCPFNRMNTFDLDTWKPRRPTRKEFYEYQGFGFTAQCSYYGSISVVRF